MGTNQARPVKTTLTSIRVVGEIRKRDGMSLTALAEELGLAKSTVHNHLATLTQEGLLVKNGNQYQVGLRFLELGEYARNRDPLYKPAKIQVYRLAETTNEEVNFAVEENGFMYTIEYVMGDSNPSNPEAGSRFLKTGNKFHMHNSASGKAILSKLSTERVESIIDRRGLEATTENTIGDRSELLEELDAVRERGYATNNEELRRGYRSIAAPVERANGSIVGALSIGGPAYRFRLTQSSITEMVNLLLEAVEDVEQEIAELDGV